MESRAERERVKPCLSCDRWIPFHAMTCPHCGKEQPAGGREKPCAVCSAAIPRRSLYCPECGCLAVPAAFVSGAGIAREREGAGDGEGRAAEFVRRALAAAAFLFEAWVVLDVTGLLRRPA